MEVYVVELDNTYDFYDVIGVYTDRERASEAIDAYPGEDARFRVQVFTLNAPAR